MAGLRRSSKNSPTAAARAERSGQDPVGYSADPGGPTALFCSMTRPEPRVAESLGDAGFGDFSANAYKQ